MMHGYVPPLREIDKAINKAIDDYLLMERKARAWDELRLSLFPSESRVLAEMDALVPPTR